MIVPEGYEYAFKHWVDKTKLVLNDKSKGPEVIEDMSDTLFGLWMGSLRGNDMVFYKWLDKQKRELEDYVHSDDVQSK